ncbi:MAG TPA: DUF5946 family protein [Candidatus Angelobacter sp.]
MGEKCPDCGAPVGGREECQKLFDEVLARHFSDALYFSVHRTAVDCYSLQHPERYCASFKSFAAHLTGLCCAMEFNREPDMMRAVHTGLDGSDRRTRPSFVEPRGEITIEAVHGASELISHREAVQAWANSVWKAWRQYHDLARTLLAEMVESARSRKTPR